MAWNDERTERAKTLWADGKSGAEIAGELGGITRSAVIGKLHRLGLTKSHSPTRALPPSGAPVGRPYASVLTHVPAAHPYRGAYAHRS